jgi:predicted phage replisome organizer/uncharacterized phage protein (TIGR02220 family)
MVEVKWIKIVTDIFDDEKVLLIESMPEADGIIVIWFKILCLAGRINNGGVLMLNDKIAYTDEMLATIFRRPVNTVRLAISTFEKFGMIEVINNAITIPNWGKHQSLDQMEKRNEYMKEYMQEYRKKQKALANGEEKVNCKVNGKTNVNTLDIEGELEVDIDKDIYIQVIDYLNEKTGKTFKENSKATRRVIAGRLKEGFTLGDFKKVIDIKVNSWSMDPKMSTYLRPETLFGNKFEGYLNEKLDEKIVENNYGW